jgi:hypothetical protein
VHAGSRAAAERPYSATVGVCGGHARQALAVDFVDVAGEGGAEQAPVVLCFCFGPSQAAELQAILSGYRLQRSRCRQNTGGMCISGIACKARYRQHMAPCLSRLQPKLLCSRWTHIRRVPLLLRQRPTLLIHDAQSWLLLVGLGHGLLLAACPQHSTLHAHRYTV